MSQFSVRQRHRPLGAVARPESHREREGRSAPGSTPAQRLRRRLPLPSLRPRDGVATALARHSQGVISS